MMLCPIAAVAGCRKCPAFSICPLKGVIGDYKASEDLPSQPPTKERGKSRTAKRAARKP